MPNDNDACDNDLLLVKLHKHPEFKEECMRMLNSQWPRSESLRYRSLNLSCDELPTSLVLITKSENNQPQVLGHARINFIPNKEDSLWIESVIVQGDQRGKGLGRILMAKTEDYIKSLGFKNVVLSTHGEQGFYSKLGYDFCPPISLYGGVVNKLFLPKNLTKYMNCSPSAKTEIVPRNNNTPKPPQRSIDCNQMVPPPPPPPPPLSLKTKLKASDIQRLDTKHSKLYMKKSLLTS